MILKVSMIILEMCLTVELFWGKEGEEGCDVETRGMDHGRSSVGLST